jgi:hypothetical protein
MVRKYLKTIARYCINRLKERSTRVSVVAIAGSVGVVINPTQLESWVAISIAVMGVIEAVFPDKPAEVVAIEK